MKDITERLRTARHVDRFERDNLLTEAADEIERLRGLYDGETMLEVRTTWQFDNAKDAPHSFLPAHSLPVKAGTKVALVVRS